MRKEMQWLNTYYNKTEKKRIASWRDLFKFFFSANGFVKNAKSLNFFITLYSFSVFGALWYSTMKIYNHSLIYFNEFFFKDKSQMGWEWEEWW